MEIDPLALNDFGFTTVDETELATFKKAITEIESKGEDIENL